MNLQSLSSQRQLRFGEVIRSIISEFLIREKNWLKSGGKFLLPYPKLKVVK